MEISDRYAAAGIDHPNQKTVCDGECEGMGTVPIDRNETDEVFKKLWLEAEEIKKSDDGYHCVKCPTCNGSGVRR